MFLFSESSGSPIDPRTIDEFEQRYNDKKYEAKMSKLLKRCYSREKRTEGGKGPWKEALAALRKEDFYGLVMVDKAGIPRPVPADLAGFDMRLVLFGVVELAFVALGCVLIFQPWRLHLALPDWLRLLLYPIFAGILWFVGQAFGYLELARIANRIARKQRG